MSLDPTISGKNLVPLVINPSISPNISIDPTKPNTDNSGGLSTPSYDTRAKGNLFDDKGVKTDPTASTSASKADNIAKNTNISGDVKAAAANVTTDSVKIKQSLESNLKAQIGEMKKLIDSVDLPDDVNENLKKTLAQAQKDLAILQGVKVRVQSDLNEKQTQKESVVNNIAASGMNNANSADAKLKLKESLNLIKNIDDETKAVQSYQQQQVVQAASKAVNNVVDTAAKNKNKAKLE